MYCINSAGESGLRADYHTFVFDAAGQAIARVDPLLRRATTGYDAAGRVVLDLDPRGVRVTSVCDPARQRVRERQALLGIDVIRSHCGRLVVGLTSENVKDPPGGAQVDTILQ